MAMYLMKKLTMCNHSEIAEAMGEIKCTAVAQNTYRFNKMVREDECLAALANMA